MRNLITGVDAEGRSCIVEETQVLGAPVHGIPGVTAALLYRTDQTPPPPRPPALADGIDVQLPPGIVRWIVIEHQPHATPTAATNMHYTDTLDFVYVLEGSADFVLEDGAHELATGDCVVTTGVDHAWRAGSVGCRLLVCSIGTPPPS